MMLYGSAVLRRDF